MPAQMQKAKHGGAEERKTNSPDPDPKLAKPSVPPLPPVDSSGPAPAKHRRQIAQQTAPQPGAPPTGAPAIVTQAQILARAEQHMHRREGAACLAALDEHRGEWDEQVAERAERDRGTCELLAGRCDEGKKRLERICMNPRATTPNVAQGLLGAEVSRLCPVASFPTVHERVMAVSLQANVASSDKANQSRWCSTLERALLADTTSTEVESCLAQAVAPRKPSSESCYLLLHNLDEAYRYLTECFLRDKDCTTGAQLDVMHSQVGFRAIAVDNPRINLFCRAERVVEVYTACTAAGEEAERKCRDRVEAARNAGDTWVTPVFPR